MNTFELKMHRVNTTAFIGHRPTSVILVPIEKVDTPAGGYKVNDLPPRDPQTFRIIELGQSSTPPVLQLTDGSQREAEFWLLGEHDAQIAIGDHWTAIDGRHWEVGDLVRSNDYETRALVAERGK
jgi:hypothetical protein